MDNRTFALKYMDEALTLDSAGNHEPAFSKYLQSLNFLTMTLCDMFTSLGFQGMMGQNQEINLVLRMIQECSDRVAFIVNTSKSDDTTIAVTKKEVEHGMPYLDTESSPSQKFPAFEKLQIENMRLLKQYQWRCERTKDDFVKTNLRLELERQLVENSIVAKRKFDMAVKQLQKERALMMEKHMKALLEKKQHLTKDQKEKQELYLSVFQYTKTETWTGAWELNSLELMPTEEATQRVFQKTIRCRQHPLSQWLLVVQTNIKREIDSKLILYSQYKSLPDLAIDENIQIFRETSSEFMIIHQDASTVTVSKNLIKSLQMFLETKAAELTNIIETVLEIFYLIYKSLLPEDSENCCYRLIETHILEPLWSNFLLLVRILNISSEYKISQAMRNQESSCPIEFSSEDNIDPEVSKDCILLLKKLPLCQSVTEKLQIMVKICQILCETPPEKAANERKLGADELMPLLCHVIVKSGMPQLSSECFAIEQLFDTNYMFGEEGYALATFLTALKYIEIRKEIVKETD